ncbi:hypothetical protein L195_g060032, partial [Trifolium pratense]
GYLTKKVHGVLVKRREDTIQVGWQPPSECWVKLNKDGACKGGGFAGCGGVVRGHHGE